MADAPPDGRSTQGTHELRRKPMVLLLRSTFLLVAVAIVVFGFGHPGFRHADGWLAPRGWLVAVLGLSLGLIGQAWRRPWQTSGWWFAIAMIGQSAALQLIFAPPYGIYQHVLTPGEIAVSWRLGCIVCVVAHGLCAGYAALKSWPGLWRTVRANLNPLQLLLLVLFLLNARVLVSTDGLQGGFGVLFVFWVAIAGALSLMLAVRALPGTVLEKCASLAARLTSGATGSGMARRLPWMVAAWVALASAAIAYYVYEEVPHVSDSNSYLFQAKYFSQGVIHVPPPPDEVSFKISHLINDDGKWYAYGFPGWPAMLALGVLAGVPWLVNPLLAALSILLAHRLIRRLYGIPTAHAVILLLAVSPWFLFMSASFMAHTLSLTLALAAFVAVERARDSKDLLLGAVAGASLGLLFLTRPIEGVLMSLAVALRIFGLGGPRPPFRMVSTICAGAILVGALIFPYNSTLTGDPLYPAHLKFTEENWYEGVDRLGFGPDIGNVGWWHHDPLPGHSPVNALLNANKNSYAADLELFGWSFGSLAFIALAFLFKGWRRNDNLFWGILGALFLVSSLYWHPGGPDYGARYWYQALLPFVVLTVRGGQLLADRLGGPGGEHPARIRVTLFIALASLAAVLCFIPWRVVGKYHRYKGHSNEVAELARESGFESGALVFVRSLSNELEDDLNDYQSAFILNPPFFDGPETVYARYLTPEKLTEVKAMFPGRPVWIVGRDAPGRPIRVIRRPDR